ncbi:hypothetical protein MCOR27_005881 [Pyricularia oryzae]|uniref:Uncharacterized protein n=2 Tax=Pyricularia TaxID=48558 RepID=A0ABQ8P1I4_PYRGI|nr:hypothetical protein MCOR01_004740 [Pyricularia oryzae]KAI6304947.1 hypothetical protein MCOR33_000069 [Pyricularia grisea]KAH9431445.1 hypothetical protein MCOR02_008734 [Pyricularia oryzae]KAI6256193.1 hypothetical protein MCOR19_007363 [Pyricularia oryzae]KAI6277907.1 hypothetical protein MCOR27_005881 [Pyricularia oryzae]
MGHRTLIYQDAFNHQELEVELARKALNLSVGPPPFKTEWGYAHGTSDDIWPPPRLGGEPEHDYVERVVVHLDGLPHGTARSDILKAAKLLTGESSHSFGILYVTIPEPGNVFVYCTDSRNAALLAELFDRDGFPWDMRGGGGAGSVSSKSSGGSTGGSSRGSRGGGGARIKTVEVYSVHCQFKISSQFLQHLQDVRGRKGKYGADEVRKEWEVTHPSGRLKPSRR